jgi:hypothetical protein
VILTAEGLKMSPEKDKISRRAWRQKSSFEIGRPELYVLMFIAINCIV